MKLIKVWIIILCSIYIQKTFAQNNSEYYIDENGKNISKDLFLKRWRNAENNLTRWNYKEKDSGLVNKLNFGRSNRLKVKYDTFLKEIQKITGIKYDSKTVFYIRFGYLNDHCGKTISNKITSTDLERIQKNLKPIYKHLKEKYPSTVYFILKEEGITIENTDNTLNKKVVFADNGFFRKYLFTNPTICGSGVIIKPNGETFLYNGETTSSFYINALNQDNWNKLFN
tara:strand:- start:51 stop:731 length:681 start_codon:yes stop_codon:yes gene_type:complete